MAIRGLLALVAWIVVASAATGARASETVRVGVHEAPPFVSIADGRPRGFAVDVLESIAAENDWQLEFVPGTWTEQLQWIDSGSIDLLVPVSRSHARPGDLEFGREPLLSTWGRVFARESTEAETLLQLDGRRIAVVSDDAFGRELAALLREFEVDFELVHLDSSAEAFKAVLSDAADVAAVERIDGGAQADGFGLSPTPIIFHPTAARFAAPAGHSEFLDAIDVALDEQKRDPQSAYRRAFDQWLATGSSRSVSPAWVVPVLIVFVGVLALAAIFVVVLRSRVKVATSELRVRNEQLRHEADHRAIIEEQLREAQKMEAVGQLAAGVAHDFNNLLTVIQSYAELLDEEDAQLRQQASEAVKQAAKQAAGLTRQLLAFARRQTLQVRVIGVNALLSRSEMLLRGALREDIRLTLDLAIDVPDVEVDPGQIEQVLLNLVVNARDAMPGGGDIAISTRAVDLGAVQHAEICVRDTGEGMDDATRQRVFEPFFTTKERTGGTGLGLPVVYGIVCQSGGQVELDSKVGVGTTLRIRLPAATSDASPESGLAPQGSTKLPGRVRVLLVEDNAAVRSSLGHALEKHGLTVLSARNGEDALEVARGCAHDIDIVVTDVVMPGMRGPELAQHLAKLGVAAPVLFTSGYAAADLGALGTIGSDVNYLQKPFTPSVLAARIAEILARQAARDGAAHPET